MRVDTLEAYNIDSDILAIWRERVGAELLPVQERAVKEFGLFGEGNLVVFAPTSSGKTFVGEMAAVRAARAKKKVFYLVPMKALAEEKYEEFRRRYERAGFRVVISTRDRREFDSEIETGDFDIAVVVFEKLQGLLVGRPQLTRTVGLVVVDELQLITDESRGPNLELLLTKLLSSRPRPRIIGLSAVLGKAHLLAKWLEAGLLVENGRPVELRKGVLSRGVFTYFEHNTGVQGTEAFADCGSDKQDALLLSAAEDLFQRHEQVLIFLPDRKSTVEFAGVLAGRVTAPSLTDAIDELRGHEETQAREHLIHCLESSVAFHNSDLAPQERELVERYFRTGAIRALFSTSTLAMGMNLPVKNVILDVQKWKHFRQFNTMNKDDITKSEYENMSGRAGRLSQIADFGRSILVTSSPFRVKVWLDYYVKRDFDEIVPTLKDEPLEDHVINLLASGMAKSRAELAELLLGSYTGFAYWSQKMSRDEFLVALDRAISVCAEGNLTCEVKGNLEASKLGRASATKGIGVGTTIALAEWVLGADPEALSTLEILSIVGMTPAGRQAHCAMKGAEESASNYRAQVLKLARKAGIAHRALFKGFAENRFAAEYEVSKALKKALFLCEWIEEARTKEIEERYLIWAGALRRVAEEFGWLVEALAAIVKACDWPDTACRELEALSDRLVHGVREDALPIARLRVRGLGRVLIRRLLSAGLADQAALRDAGPDRVRSALSHGGGFAALWAKVNGDAEAAPPFQYPLAFSGGNLRAAEPAVPYVAEPDPPPSPLLVVDVREHRIHYRGIEIPTKPPANLQPQLFRALAVLATHAGKPVGMAQMAEEMFALGGLRRRPVAPEQRDLRYRIIRILKSALAPAVAATEIEALVENIVGIGLRLAVPGGVHVTGAPPI